MHRRRREWSVAAEALVASEGSTCTPPSTSIAEVRRLETPSSADGLRLKKYDFKRGVSGGDAERKIEWTTTRNKLRFNKYGLKRGGSDGIAERTIEWKTRWNDTRLKRYNLKPAGSGEDAERTIG